jgi:Tfp pilus assembly protein PilF
MDRFGKTTDAYVADQVARTCILGPNAIPDMKPAVALARVDVQASPQSGEIRNTLGAALFRSGQYDGAVSELNEAIKLQQFGKPVDLVFLAMAHYQLVKSDESRTMLGKAVAGEKSSWAAMTQTQQSEFQLLRREAEALIKGPAPKDTK